MYRSAFMFIIGFMLLITQIALTQPEFPVDVCIIGSIVLWGSFMIAGMIEYKAE